MVLDPRRVLARRVYYGWVVAVACLLSATAAFGTSYTFSVFYDPFIDEFGVSRGTTALVFGVQTVFIYTGAAVAGRSADRHGQRRVVAVAGVLLVGGLAWAALARSYLELLAALGVVAGLGISGLYVVGYATVPLWFERRRGFASGLAAAGLGVGLVAVPPGAASLVSTVGWRTAMLAVAGAAGLLAFLVVLLLADGHEDVGADPGVEFDEEAGPERDASGPAQGGVDVRALLHSVPFLLVLAGWVLVFVPIYTVQTHVVLYATDAGFGRSTGVFAITVLGVTIVGGRLAVGHLSDRVGRVRSFTACGGLAGAALVGLTVAPTAGAFLAIVVLFALGYSGIGGLIAPVLADLFGNEDLNTLFGVTSVAFAVSGLAAPPAVGYWSNAVGSYGPPFVAAGLAGVVGAGCVLLASRLT